jgi:hypothetical protein
VLGGVQVVQAMALYRNKAEEYTLQFEGACMEAEDLRWGSFQSSTFFPLTHSLARLQLYLYRLVPLHVFLHLCIGCATRRNGFTRPAIIDFPCPVAVL